ncbi:uncharacterized protein LOC114533454 [Dendronephthya gigantea]|uniref:uncharacterized protein LOC114533454 n=1 Tax=Dendronephthya gigantea TaxID=151771 RepID=UPI00106C33BC|nr:uncharacterized protein LOC114533454 [Dendronephthya gigantea]
MRALIIETVILMQLLQLSTVLSCCDIANWWDSFNLAGLSECLRDRTYIKGLWRNEQRDTQNLFLIEEAKCCDAVIQDYTWKSSSCQNANWRYTLDGINVWAKCPRGYFLRGFTISMAVGLSHIEEAKCCHPQTHPNEYGDCYEEDVSISFDNKGWSECKRQGYYMAGFYKGTCDGINCIEKFYCCQMKHYGNTIIGKRSARFRKIFNL